MSAERVSWQQSLSAARRFQTVNALVSTVERSPTPNGSTRLTIRCKHFQSLALIVAKEKDANDIYDVLTARGRICKQSATRGIHIVSACALQTT